jgi:hypothetical protein
MPVQNRFRLETMPQIASKQGGTKNIAITTSSTFDAVALISRDGTTSFKSNAGYLQLKPDGQQLGGLSKDKNRNVQSRPEAVTISFSDTGDQLLFLDNHVPSSLTLLI